MIITKTPFRVSFFGGGTDYPEYFEEYGGCVLTSTINKYCYVTTRFLPPFFEYKNKLTYSKIEVFNSADEVRNPLVREAMKLLGMNELQISYDADLPARSGLGTSSSFAVGLLKGLHTMRGETPDAGALAKEAIRLERELCAEAGGWQDQAEVAYGGLNRISFSKDGFKVEPVNLPKSRISELESRLLLVFTGFTHFAGEVSETQKKNIKSSLQSLHELRRLTDEAHKILTCGGLDDFGRLLRETWELKRSLSDKITTERIDGIYGAALEAGALGGKLLGAGGGGFMLFYADPARHEAVRARLRGLNFIPFTFVREGSEIIYNNS